MEFDISGIRQKIKGYQQKGLKLFASSSFQSHSLPMLHMISRIDSSIPVYFLNTGYHFPQTIEYKEQVTDLLGLNVIDLFSSISRHMQRNAEGRLYFTSDPDHCCYINKIQPMEPILAEYDVWINGVRRDQNGNRQQLGDEEEAPGNVIRYHPVLNFTKQMISRYMHQYQLPPHPLESYGYLSVGCEPCTQKMDLEGMLNDRNGRWNGMNKTECGLHTDLISKK